jgi:hypothetical protein
MKHVYAIHVLNMKLVIPWIFGLEGYQRPEIEGMEELSMILRSVYSHVKELEGSRCESQHWPNILPWPTYSMANLALPVSSPDRARG